MSYALQARSLLQSRRPNGSVTVKPQPSFRVLHSSLSPRWLHSPTQKACLAIIAEPQMSDWAIVRNFRGCWPFSKEKPLLRLNLSLCRLMHLLSTTLSSTLCIRAILLSFFGGYRAQLSLRDT